MLTFHRLDRFEPSLSKLLQELRLQDDSPDTSDVLDLVAEAKKRACPKGVSRVGHIEARNRNTITVNGVDLKSRGLRVNTDHTMRVFAFAATSGTELAAWANGLEDPVLHFYALSITEYALNSMVELMEQDLHKKFKTGPLARMLPGSLQDWPIHEQGNIFHLLGQARRTSGFGSHRQN